MTIPSSVPATMPFPRIALDMSQGEFIHILKACQDRQAKLRHIESTSDDEDAVADAGNDLIEIGMIIRWLEKRADEQWTPGGWTTSDKPI